MGSRYLTLSDRREIKAMYDAESSVLDIALKVGKHPQSIYDELKRGYTGQLDQNSRPEYDPDLAQERVQRNIRARGNRRKRVS